jgi:hypothetical protein
MTTDLVMYRGDDRDFLVTITDDSLPFDLSGYSVMATFRADIDDADPVFVLDSSVALGAGFQIDIDADQITNAGQLTLHVREADTIGLERGLTLLGDIQLTDIDGLIRTAPEPAFGHSTLIRLKIRADVTHP